MANLQDRLKDAAQTAAYGVGRAARAVRDAAASPEGQRLAADAKYVGRKAADASVAAMKRAVPVVRDIANKTADAARDVAAHARTGYGEAMRGSGRRLDPSAGAGSAVDGTRAGGSSAGEPAWSSAEWPSIANPSAGSSARASHRTDGRPRVTVDDATGQEVQTEVYVINEDGTRDYNVYPDAASDPTRRMSPMARKVAGLILILAGIPMLVLPGPGMAAIAAGLALMGVSTGDDGTADSQNG